MLKKKTKPAISKKKSLSKIKVAPELTGPAQTFVWGEDYLIPPRVFSMFRKWRMRL